MANHRQYQRKEGGNIESVMVEAAEAGGTLAAALRRRMPERSWNEVRRLCTTGKVRVDSTVALDPATRLRAGQTIAVVMAAPRPRTAPAGFRIAFEDGHVIVIEKPAGISTVPYERKETGTAMDLVRDAWRHAGKRATKTPLYVVHRIDKDTSGLVCFAKTRLAERALHGVFQRHEAARAYLAVAEGAVTTTRIESRLVPDRGDGIRGSTRSSLGNPGRVAKARSGDGGFAAMDPSRPGPSRDDYARQSRAPSTRSGEGQHAVTHVEALRGLRGRHAGPRVLATLCRVRLETGRTHQIRIHLSERGHPLVGETVYIRDLLRGGGTPLPASRLMLHAALLGFPHPVTGEPIELRAAPPADYLAVLESLGGTADDCHV